VEAEHAPVSIEIPVYVSAGASLTFATTANTNGHAYITLDSAMPTKVKITGAVGHLSDSAALNWQMAVPPPPRLISLPDTTAHSGDTLRVALSIEDAAGITGVEAIVFFDSNILQVLDASLTSLTEGFVLADSLSSGRAKISLARATGIPSGSGALAEVAFQVIGTSGDSTVLNLDSIALYNENGEVIPVSTQSGSVDVIGPVRMMVWPDTAIVELGEIQDFLCKGVDIEGSEVPVEAMWTVEPAELGDITAEGGFMGSARGQGWVIAQSEMLSDSVVVWVGEKGDVNLDGRVDTRDAILCMRIQLGLPLPPLLGHMHPTMYDRWAADMNRDGAIGEEDALLVLYKSFGRSVPKPVIHWVGVEALTQVGERMDISADRCMVPIRVEGRPDVCGAQVRLWYDPVLLSPVEIWTGVSGGLVEFCNGEEGTLVASLVSADGLVGSDGCLLWVCFEEKGNLKGRNPVELESIRLFDPSAAPIEVGMQEPLLSTDRMIPEMYGLSQNIPNPFNTCTEILIQIPQARRVVLRIYNLNGQIVRTLVDGPIEAGEWRIVWDGRDEDGQAMSSGVYVYRLVGEHGWTKTMKLVLLR
jgi:hypothetical protein